jgi:hypothetical protein
MTPRLWILPALAVLSFPTLAGSQGSPQGSASPRRPAAEQESPFACDVQALTPQERHRHFEELGPALRARKTGVRELPDGYEFEFPADPESFRLLSEWTYQERLCCPFFDIALLLHREGGPLRLRLTGRPGTKAFIEADGKAWLAP